MLNDEQYRFIADGCEDMELDAVWDFFEHPYGTGRLRHAYCTFDERKEAFLWVLKRLLVEQRIVLVNMQTHEPIEGTIDRQVERFRRALPKKETEMSNGFWFFSESCPGGSAWQR